MTVLFIGPLPPPVHGFSVINAAMLGKLQQAAHVVVFDRAPKLNVSKLSSVASMGASVFRFLRHASKRDTTAVYLALSGGAGQWLDLAFICAAKTFGRKIYIHHHSFAYLNKPTLSAKCVVACAKGAVHIVLCTEMGRALAESLGVPAARCVVLSNAAFLAEALPSKVKEAGHAVRVGFLSNITAEKGIFEFIATVEQAAAQGIELIAEVAGPVDPAIAEEFARVVAGSQVITHLGPLYGADKEAFFDRTDLFLFPTQYPNEAEPVTILEALRAGAEVVAASRGCIDDMLCSSGSAAVPLAEFRTTAILKMRQMVAASAAQRKQVAKQMQIHFDHLRLANQQRLAFVIEAMTAHGQPCAPTFNE